MTVAPRPLRDEESDLTLTVIVGKETARGLYHSLGCREVGVMEKKL